MSCTARPGQARRAGSADAARPVPRTVSAGSPTAAEPVKTANPGEIRTVGMLPRHVTQDMEETSERKAG